MDSEWVSDLDGTECADALADSHVRIVEVELMQVRLVAHWCELHGGDAVPDAGSRLLRGAEQSVRLGGAGTPRVLEFAAAELGLLLGLSTTSARWLMRDVLDLQHRHPRLYDTVLAGRTLFFQARHVVRATHHAGLSLGQARQVDERLAPYLGQVTWAAAVARRGSRHRGRSRGC